VLAVIAANSAGNFALRVGMQQVGRTVSLSPLPYLSALLNGWVLAGVVLLIGWLILQLSLLSRADLAYVLPVTALANTASALLGAFVLYERVSPAGWAGIGLISLGACLVAQTDSRTDSIRPAKPLLRLTEPRAEGAVLVGSGFPDLPGGGS
jgi:drug/metabolite transporter (DMT)-like permease